MKKIVSLLLALMMMAFCAFALAEAPAELPTEPEFDPNPDYTEYTVVEYTIEAIQADLVCTVHADDLLDILRLNCFQSDLSIRFLRRCPRNAGLLFVGDVDAVDGDLRCLGF